MAIRELSALERHEAWLVFRSSVDFDSVRIADDLGLGGLPWCSPPGWGAQPYFQLHVGTFQFENDMSETGGGLLIHEMAHVWQGQRNIPLWYVINSGCNQAFSYANNGNSGGAYAIDSQSKQWKDYGAEQQASIVQGWYINGMSSSDWRYRFIRDNIRTGNPWAFSQDAKPPVWTRFKPAHGDLISLSRTTFRKGI